MYSRIEVSLTKRPVSKELQTKEFDWENSDTATSLLNKDFHLKQNQKDRFNKEMNCSYQTKRYGHYYLDTHTRSIMNQ